LIVQGVDGPGMSENSVDTSRSVVKTYVPAHQKEVWADHADRLDMSQSEFVRTMVQAGRREFDIESGDPDSRDATPGEDGLEDRLVGVLRQDGPLEPEEIVDALTEDVESRLGAVLEQLQRDDVVRHDPMNGYRLVEAP